MRSDKIDTISLNSLYDIVSLYLNLSKYKDSHSKILVTFKLTLEWQKSALGPDKPSLYAKIRIFILENPLTFK
jgi:hypothetical protein